MGSQLPALEQLFDEWAKKHAEKISTAAPYFMPEQENPYGGFVRDGIINLESWKKQKVRICFILNEAGGRNEMEQYPDGFDLAAEWNERGSFSKFMFKLCVWTKAIQDAFGAPITYKKADVLKIRDDLIRSIAVVNVKKSDGQRRSDFEVLKHFANEDADELRRELELVNPNIIICCENMKFLREPLPIKPKKQKKSEDGETEATETTDATATAETAETAATAETAETVAAEATEVAETITPEQAEGEPLNYVFRSKDVQPISKFTYLWGNKLVFSMWTPANFMGTISSNTLNYYAIRGIVRAALKAFGDKQRRQKIKQMNDQKHEEKLQRKAEQAAAKAAKAATETPAPAAKPAEQPAPAVKPVATPETPAPAEKPAAEKPAAEKPAAKKTATKKTAAKTETADAPATDEKPATRKTTRTKKTAAPKDE